MCVHDILFILFIYQQINLMNKTIFNKRASLKFSHFSNKGYSLFSVLGRVVAIGALSVTTLTYAKAEGISVEEPRLIQSLSVEERLTNWMV